MKHIKRILFFLLFCIFCLTKCATFAAKAQDEQSLASEVKEAQEGRGLSLEQCIRFAIGNSFEVKLARLDFLIAQTDQGIEQAIYDTVLSADISYEKDKRQLLSVFAADEAQTRRPGRGRTVPTDRGRFH